MKPVKRILVVNDDGIEAEGLKVAEELAYAVADDVWVIAPAADQHGVSHAFSVDLPIRAFPLGPRRFTVTGTPGDCIAMAVKSIMVDRLPDLVISGVNAGANVADDIAYSGTVSGAMISALCGIPAIAFSQAIAGSDEPIWPTARLYGARALALILWTPLPEDLCLNINFPATAPDAVTGIRATRQGRRLIGSIDIDARTDLRGKPYYWLDLDRSGGEGQAGSDLAALYDKAVSVTPLNLDRTDDAALAVLQRLL